jgi:hypothetical protein
MEYNFILFVDHGMTHSFGIGKDAKEAFENSTLTKNYGFDDVGLKIQLPKDIDIKNIIIS